MVFAFDLQTTRPPRRKFWAPKTYHIALKTFFIFFHTANSTEQYTYTYNRNCTISQLYSTKWKKRPFLYLNMHLYLVINDRCSSERIFLLTGSSCYKISFMNLTYMRFFVWFKVALLSLSCKYIICMYCFDFKIPFPCIWFIKHWT